MTNSHHQLVRKACAAVITFTFLRTQLQADTGWTHRECRLWRRQKLTPEIGNGHILTAWLAIDHYFCQKDSAMSLHALSMVIKFA